MTENITIEEIKDLLTKWTEIYNSMDKRKKGAKESKVFVDSFTALLKERTRKWS